MTCPQGTGRGVCAEYRKFTRRISRGPTSRRHHPLSAHSLPMSVVNRGNPFPPFPFPQTQLTSPFLSRRPLPRPSRSNSLHRNAALLLLQPLPPSLAIPSRSLDLARCPKLRPHRDIFELDQKVIGRVGIRTRLRAWRA